MKYLVFFIFFGIAGCSNLSKYQPIAISHYPDFEATTELLQGADDAEKKDIRKKVKNAGSVYVWQPYTSAAIVDAQGNRCVLAASGAKTIDASSEVLIKLAAKIKSVDITEFDSKFSEELKEAFTKTSEADARSAFADIALFHLCLLDQNGTFGVIEKPDCKAPDVKLQNDPNIIKAWSECVVADYDSQRGMLKPKALLVLKAYEETIKTAATLVVGSSSTSQSSTTPTSTTTRSTAPRP